MTVLDPSPEAAVMAVRVLLAAVGEDPDRDGLADTPGRVVKSLLELTDGYSLDPAEVLGKTFDVGDHDGMVVLKDVPFTSLCEHHLLPFSGVVTIGYLPDTGQRVVGLSKLARLVDVYARRLQVQERMTNQLVEAVATHLYPLGVGAQVRAHHLCMSCRGIRKAGVMVTSALHGSFRDDAQQRAEFLSLCGQ